MNADLRIAMGRTVGSMVSLVGLLVTRRRLERRRRNVLKEKIVIMSYNYIYLLLVDVIMSYKNQ